MYKKYSQGMTAVNSLKTFIPRKKLLIQRSQPDLAYQQYFLAGRHNGITFKNY